MRQVVCAQPAALPRASRVRSQVAELRKEQRTRATVPSAAFADEAQRWGIDLGVWRAHVGAATWPEVLRQFAIVAGWGPRRCKAATQRPARSLSEGHFCATPLTSPRVAVECARARHDAARAHAARAQGRRAQRRAARSHAG